MHCPQEPKENILVQPIGIRKVFQEGKKPKLFTEEYELVDQRSGDQVFQKEGAV
jgi:hypothetical protein